MTCCLSRQNGFEVHAEELDSFMLYDSRVASTAMGSRAFVRTVCRAGNERKSTAFDDRENPEQPDSKFLMNL